MTSFKFRPRKWVTKIIGSKSFGEAPFTANKMWTTVFELLNVLKLGHIQYNYQHSYNACLNIPRIVKKLQEFNDVINMSFNEKHKLV